jgi:beta-ketodecanoyl-[acyl-carrier-protein] synthase
MAEMALDRLRQGAGAWRGVEAGEVDLVICAASNHERAYPAIAIEIQQLLGAGGFAFDMNVACSSATFGIQAAADMVRAGSCRARWWSTPRSARPSRMARPRLPFHLRRRLHRRPDRARRGRQGRPISLIRSTRCATQFSNNIRNNNGFLRRTRQGHMEDRRDMQFMQNGRKVFKEVLPLVSAHIAAHMADEGVERRPRSQAPLAAPGQQDDERLHRRKVLGRVPEPEEQPNILQDYANTSSAGSIIAFAKYSDDLARATPG